MKKITILLLISFLFSCNSTNKNKVDSSKSIESLEETPYEIIMEETGIEEDIINSTAHLLNIKPDKVHLFGAVLKNELNYIWFAMENTQGTNRMVYQYKFIAHKKDFDQVSKSRVRGGPFAVQDEIAKLTGK